MSDAMDDLLDEEAPKQSWFRWLVSTFGPLALLPFVMLAVGTLRAPSLPAEAPEVIGVDLSGNPTRLSDFRGQTVVLNFWATWCGPCRVEIPVLSSFARNNPDIVVLGLTTEDQAGQLARFAADKGMEYPVVITTAEMFQRYSVTTLPTTVVVDEQGHIASAYSGMVLPPHLWWMTW